MGVRRTPMALTLTSVFADLPDPRTETANRRHHLTDILCIATCAVIAGAESWEQIAQYGRSKEDFFRRFLELPNGIPSHDTFYRVFAKLDPDAFADRFARWMAEVGRATGLARPDIDGPTHVAIDGKSARRSEKATFSGCLHLVEAWAVESRLILGQRSVPEGGHEITAFPEVLATLDLSGAVVTMDAAGCQTEILSLIRERGGEYVVCVKGNQPTLQDAIAGVFDRAAESGFAGCDAHASVTDAHGRHEERSVTVVTDPEGLPPGWAGVGSVALVCRDRQGKGKEAESTGHYYLSSLRVDAAELAGYIRRHWGIESMHWVLDVAFREDESRTEAGHAGANLGMIRRVAVSLLNRAGKKGSIQTRRLRAAWDDQYLIQVLQGLYPHSA
jgi:predicted transposase YbfD/YdcC